MNDIIFRIGPRINASGRVQNGTETVDLLVEKDIKKAVALAMHINEYNDQRRDIDKQTPSSRCSDRTGYDSGSG